MIRCPKCKARGSNILLAEDWRGHSIEFDQRDDGRIEAFGATREGAPERVTGKCLKCGHGWTLRGVRQISDIPEWLGHDPDIVRWGMDY